MNSREAKLKANEILMECKNQLIIATFVSLLIPALLSVVLTLTGIASKSIWVVLVATIIMVIWQRGILFSITKMYIVKKNGEEIQTFGFLKDSFIELKRAWGITFGLIPKFIIPILLYILSMVFIVVGNLLVFANSNSNLTFLTLLPLLSFIFMIVTLVIGIRLSYQYRYADIEAIISPDLTSKEVVDKTGKIMEGNKMESFKIDLSFLLWAFLLGIIVGFIGGLIAILEPFATAFVCAIIQVNLMMAHIVFYENLRGSSFDIMPEYIYDQERDNKQDSSNY